jgi:hypothetical protein
LRFQILDYCNQVFICGSSLTYGEEYILAALSDRPFRSETEGGAPLSSQEITRGTAVEPAKSGGSTQSSLAVVKFSYVLFTLEFAGRFVKYLTILKIITVNTPRIHGARKKEWG